MDAIEIWGLLKNCFCNSVKREDNDVIEEDDFSKIMTGIFYGRF